VFGYVCMLNFMEWVMLNMMFELSLWFVGDFFEKWVINHEMMFWWNEFFDYVGEVVSVVNWVWNSVLIMSFGYEIEFGEKQILS